jgi:hypothetical protein
VDTFTIKPTEIHDCPSLKQKPIVMQMIIQSEGIQGMVANTMNVTGLVSEVMNRTNVVLNGGVAAATGSK